MKVNITRQLRTDKPAAGTGYCPVRFIVTWRGLRKYLSPGLVVHPDHWDDTKERVKPSIRAPYATETNAKLNEWEAAILEAAEDAVTTEQLEIAVLAKMNPEKGDRRQKAKAVKARAAAPVPAPGGIVQEQAKATDFAGIWSEWLQSCRSRVSGTTGELVSDQTVQQYAATGDRLREWAHETKSPLTLAVVCTSGFYEGFRTWCLRHRKLEPNTFGKYIKHLKHFLGWCESQDDSARWPPSPKWRSFEAPNRYVGVDFLDVEEVIALQKIDFQRPEVRALIRADFEKMPTVEAKKRGQRHSQADEFRVNERARVLELARDIFLMCCYTGLRISDVETLGPRNIRGKVLQVEAGKNRIECIIPFFDDQLMRPGELVRKWTDRAPTGKIFPMLHNINEYLHDVGRIAGITRLDLTTKLGRKTFVTLSAYQGVPQRVIMQATGHQTEKSFNRYLGINIQELVKAFQKRVQSTALAA